MPDPTPTTAPAPDLDLSITLRPEDHEALRARGLDPHQYLALDLAVVKVEPAVSADGRIVQLSAIAFVPAPIFAALERRVTIVGANGQPRAEVLTIGSLPILHLVVAKSSIAAAAQHEMLASLSLQRDAARAATEPT